MGTGQEEHWYVTAARQPVNWTTAVAKQAIYEVKRRQTGASPVVLRMLFAAAAGVLGARAHRPGPASGSRPGTLRGRQGSVWIARVAAPRPPEWSRWPDRPSRPCGVDLLGVPVADLAFVALTCGGFVALGALVKAVTRL